ncbi:hypothetical protein ACTFIR_006888 [Dictyostelium discoideum]
MENDEKLFWKIFRNNYLKYKILEMIKSQFRLGCYSYEEIIYSEWMIRFNHLGLLREKVLKNDQMLIFNNSHPDCFFEYGNNEINKNNNDNNNNNNNRPKEFEFNYGGIYHNDLYDQYDDHSICYPKLSIFNVFKDDMEFFSKLFENYSYYFEVSSTDELFSTIDPIKKSVLEIPLSPQKTPIRPISISKIIHFSIVYDNLAMFKVLINYRYYIPTTLEVLNDFIKAFKTNSFIVAEFIYKEMLLVTTTATTTKTKSTITTNFLTKELIDKYWSTIILDSFLHDSKRYLKIKFIQNVLNSNSPPLSIVNPQEFVKFLRNLFDFQIFTKKLKTVIDRCIHLYHILNSLDSSIIQEINNLKSLNYFLNQSTHGFNFNTFKTLDLNDFKPLSIEELNNIKLKYENTKEYLMEIGNLESNSEHQEIKDLFKMLLFFSGKKIEINYLFYIGKYNKTFFNSDKNYYPIVSAWFGNYSIDSNKDIKNLFLYCSKNDQLEIKKQFIKSAVSDIMNKGIMENSKLSPILLFSIVLSQNNLELLEYLFKIYPNIPVFSMDSYLLEKVNSLDICLYLFNRDLIRASQLLPFFIGNYEIISYFKKNHPGDYKNSFYNFDRQSLGNFTHYQFRFILENWSDFKSKFQNGFQFFSVLPFQDFKKFVNNILIINSSLENNNNNYNNNNNNNLNENENDRNDSNPLYCAVTLEQYNYVLDKMPQDLLTGRCGINYGSGSINHLNLQLHVHYLRNNLNEKLLSTFRFNSSYFYPCSLFKEMVLRNDSKTLELFLSKIKGRHDYSWLKSEIIQIAIRFSNHFIYSFLNCYE